MVANGGIRSLDDAKRCLIETKAQAVMAGSLFHPSSLLMHLHFTPRFLFMTDALMTNPALFEGVKHDPCDLALEFVAICREHPVHAIVARGILVKMLLPLFVTSTHQAHDKHTFH